MLRKGSGLRRQAEEKPDLEWMGNAAAAIGKVPTNEPLKVYADEQLQAVAAELRGLCKRLNEARVQRRDDAPEWRCAVVDPWDAAYSKDELQRERSREEGNGDGGGWWTDNRHLHPSGDLMRAIVQLLLAAIVG